ncbi:FAD-dependent monooxygenase [Actinomadura syzygii]|uniref:FAD-binding domain-containing protein n=1 Tax=Actinomadura syzygii TaxID=1427538 RepID=A0A5D0TXZ5_9ACTN|nr:FAD-dependent monooxygenase [Actinomadura syzygii]TYC10310.1 hypothetical protein FXF65_30770 [Actinomadura syzygii]
MDPTVIIAGGGPTGLMLACELALANVHAVVVEKLLDPSGESRGMGLHARSLETLDQRGLLERFGDDTPVWPRAHFALMWMDLSDFDTTFTYIVPQWRTEKILDERARELGVDLRRGEVVVAVDQDDDGVSVGVRNAAGEEYRLRGEYLVGADGGGSTVRKLAGFDFPGTDSTYHGVLGDIEEYDAVDGIETTLYPDKGMYAAIPLGPDVLRIMTTEFDAELPPDDQEVTLDELRASVKAITGEEPRVGKPRWLSRFGNASRQVTAYRRGRIFLAGDAAHVHYPMGGQGLNSGIQDAVNLGWKLAAEINGWGPPALLDSYHAERHPVAARVARNTEAQLALLHPVGKIGPLRDLFGELLQYKEVRRHLIEMVTGIAVAYDFEYPDRADGPHPLEGRRIPNATLATSDGERTVAETLRAGHGVLLDLSGGDAESVDVSNWAGRVDLVRARPVEEIDAAVALVRPDGYIAYAHGDGSDPEGLELALKTWFG